MTFRQTLLLFVPSLLAACAGESSSERPALPNKAWKDQTHDERMVTMKKLVYPTMKDEFVRFDAKDFNDMTCATCHGPGAKDKTFKMPNPKLPMLPATEAGFEKLKKDHPEVVQFMMTTVVPKMADFLGEQPYNPKTHEGFGCFRCHLKETSPSSN